MQKKIVRTQRGFTLIELMIVVTIIGILAAIAAPNYQWGITKAKEAVLRENLYTLRTTIDQFYADQGEYPDSLEELVTHKNKYLKEVPNDPFTKSKDWAIEAPEQAEGDDIKGNVYDVHSSSPLIGTNGVPYADW